MIRRSLLITYLLMSAVLLQASRASARLRGDIELNYVSYEAQEKGTTVTDAHTFSQRYSVLYEKSGELYSDRFGFYNGALGYEWASFDSRVYNAADNATWKPSTSAGKILFNGELVLGSSRVDLQACKLGVIMVIAVSCVKLLSAHNSTQHTSRKHKV